MKTAVSGLESIGPGDVVKTGGRRVGDSGRSGEVIAVLGEDDHLHYLIRWEDGRESILYPGEGISIRPSAYPAASAD